MPGHARATDAACPRCGEHDVIMHMLGNCGHLMMKAMYIERHNAATRKILRLTLEAPKATATCLQIGSTDKLGSIGPLDSRVPEWLVPTNILERGLDRDKLRPDILMTSSTPSTPWGLSSSRPSRTSASGAGTHPMGLHIVVLKSMNPHSTHSLSSQIWQDQAQTWVAQIWVAEHPIHGKLTQAAAGRWMRQAFNVSCPI